MSATRDKNQKVTFVYSNLYALYKKGQKAAADAKSAAENAGSEPVTREEPAVEKPGLTTSQILKADDLNSESFAVTQHEAPRIQPQTAANVAAIHQKPDLFKQNPTLDSLKQNLKTLNDLHARLRFMLEELEDLVKN